MKAINKYELRAMVQEKFGTSTISGSAEKLGFAYKTMWQIFDGGSVQYRTAKNVADSLELSIDELFEEKDKKEVA